MNATSHSTDTDLTRLSARMERLERRFDDMQKPLAAVPAPLPVDKKTSVDYWRDVSSSTEADDDSDETMENPMGNLTPQHLREVVAAFDEVLRWREFPNPTMGKDMRDLIERDALRRLQEAISPLERAVKAAE